MSFNVAPFWTCLPSVFSRSKIGRPREYRQTPGRSQSVSQKPLTKRPLPHIHQHPVFSCRQSLAVGSRHVRPPEPHARGPLRVPAALRRSRHVCCADGAAAGARWAEVPSRRCGTVGFSSPLHFSRLSSLAHSKIRLRFFLSLSIDPFLSVLKVLVNFSGWQLGREHALV